jgi:AbrB family looped-hinge helix DNA binding protein
MYVPGLELAIEQAWRRWVLRGRKAGARPALWTRSYLGKMVLMKCATRVTSKGQVVIPKPVREQLRWVSGTDLAVEVVAHGAVRLTLLEVENPIDSLYGCLKNLQRDPLADLEAEHQAEIEADERWRRRGR